METGQRPSHPPHLSLKTRARRVPLAGDDSTLGTLTSLAHPGGMHYHIAGLAIGFLFPNDIKLP